MSKKLHNPKAYAPAVYIPCWLIQISSTLLSHQAKLLYGRLAQWATESGTVFRSVPQLSEELGFSKSTIDRTIKELKDCGLIGTFQPQKGGISHYEFYDHEWMTQPIKEQLSYRSNILDVTSDMTLPHVKNDVTPTSDVTCINRKEIKRNNKLHKQGTSDEVQISSKKFVLKKEAQNTSYNKFDEGNEGFESGDNQTLGKLEAIKSLEGTDLPLKSDYQNNQTDKCANSPNIQQYDINNILKNNFFQIPEQIIQDWITNRKKKRAPITVTAWNKINKELTKCKEQGIDPIESFETMVASGWMSLKVEYFITQELLSKQEASKKRSIELEQIAERRKQKEIQDSKRLNGIVSKASENARRQLRQMVGSRSPNITSS